MKKLIYTLLFVSTALLTSCSSDDDSSSDSGEINVDGNSVRVSETFIVDFGASLDHYNYDFTLIGTSDGEEYDLYLELFSPIEDDQDDEFRTGTFNYNNDFNPEGFYFNEAVIAIDDQERFATAGTVTVSGSGSDFRLVVSLTLDDGSQLTAEYDGDFEISSGTLI